MFFWLFCLAIVAIVVVAFLVLNQNRSNSTPSNLPSSPAERSIFDLQIGDIVQHGGIDWVVEDCLTYNQSGFIWQEYLLQDGTRRAWLAVEEDDWVDVQLVEPITTVDISANPTKELTVDDVIYRCVESGTASMTRKRNRTQSGVQTCQFFDYEGPNDKVLSVENWEGDIEVCMGDRISPSSITILPGDGESVYR